MKALVLAEPGTRWVLSLKDVPSPLPGPGDVRIRVQASSINPVDYKFARGGSGLTFPHVLGADAAGEIDALGDGVSDWTLGDRVMALTNVFRWGGFAEQVIVDARVLSRLPPDLPMEQAGVLPCAALTAWQAVHQKLRLQPGQTVLITAAGGGVGRYAVQMARHSGARVLGTASRDQAALQALGVEAVINYREEDFVAVMKAADGADVILDMVGGPYVQRNLAALADEGRLVQIAFLQGAKVEVNLGQLMMRRLTLTGSTLRPQSDLAKARIAEGLRAEVWPLLEAGIVAPVMDSEFPLEEAAAAHARMEAGAHVGKIVLRIA